MKLDFGFIFSKVPPLIEKTWFRWRFLHLLCKEIIPSFFGIFHECDKIDVVHKHKSYHGNLIVGIENSDGNTNVRFHQKDTQKRFFERFEQNGLTINRFRADCGLWYEDIVEKIEKHRQITKADIWFSEVCLCYFLHVRTLQKGVAIILMRHIYSHNK